MDLELPECRAIPERSQSAKNRIALSTLYLGDGSLEHALVESIDSNLKRNQNLHVEVLLDYLRGTRGVAQEKSSTTLLKTIADRAIVYLYHTPKLTGLVKAVLPERTNEIVGLQHMKLYIFDDSVLISGANLSDSYFVDRQDRYVVFEDVKELADFFSNIITAVGECSFLLDNDGSLKLHPKCSVHPYEGRFDEYRNLIRSKISQVIASLQEKHSSASQPSGDTMLYPLIQMGLFGYHEEYELLKKLFASKDSSLSLTMASGYFNCIKEYEHLIFEEGKYSMDIVTAAPKANGFFGAAGPSGYVPSMYSWVCERVLELKRKHSRNDVNLYEYHRDGWTFHAKGLWMEMPTQTATLVGSSNFETTTASNLRRAMGLLPVGLLLGKALMDNMARRAGPAQVVRTSAAVSNYYNLRSRRHVSSKTGPNPFEKEEMLHRIGGTSIRQTPAQIERDKKLLEEALLNEKWVAVYRYPGIRVGVLLARAKLLQTVASVLFLPYSSYQYLTGQVDTTFFYSTAVLAVLAPIALAVFSRYLNRLIGVIAMNESNDYVRVGYLTFWGGRKNKFLEVTDVLPLSEVSGSKNDSLIRFSWFGGDNFLYLPTRNVEIVDEKRAELLFGDLSVFSKPKKE
ncbi:phospholipase D domain protein [Oesophagostomum dentatum]|uniref:CDP-diacylglycerol--glycerol-3-phosphate 3-phosphatidyltransferase n=1 Tax=Oesophagostomum dentatum TaxID=61180 RepID=A0A0B1SZR9_OESDE|nr:phospholipase D domain protein [Oesophagostomum dentatum]